MTNTSPITPSPADRAVPNDRDRLFAHVPRKARSAGALRLLVLTLLLWLSSSASSQVLPREARLAILDAVVQIVPWDEEAEALAPWSGSGTFISPSGYILTNYHVIGDLDRRTTYEWHLIYITGSEFTDMPPEAVFWAQYVAGDATHDLAILKVREWVDETPVDPDLWFPHVQVGDSNRLLPGDYITIVGYPGVSGSTITFTAGLMSGWLGEDLESGGRQWIKTDGKIAHGNSGGAAFNEAGHLIGVPTAGRTVQWAELDVEEQAYVRPISLAWALIGPHVPDVARAGSATAADAQGPGAADAGSGAGTGATQDAAPATPATAQPGAAATTQQPAAQATGSSSGCEFCFVGNITLGQVANHRIVGQAEGGNYHTYGVQVPEGVVSMVIDLSADFDVDIAIKYGSDIQSWSDTGDWDYRDITEAYGGKFTINYPRPGVWYVDVIFYYEDGSATYALTVQ